MKKTMLSLLLTLVGTLSLTSCGFFNTGSAGYLIQDATTSVNENGDTVLVITFDDPEEPPMEITIPQGASGVGIADIDSSYDEETSLLTITITYTDSSLSPYVIEVPVIQGTDGAGIESIGVEPGEDGATILVFHFTDGREPVRVSIPQGERGVGIASITRVDYENPDYLILQVTYDDESIEPTLIQIPLSELRGDGIAYITLEDNGDQYVLRIEYTSGFVNTVPFEKPQATQWLYGNGNPLSSQGRTGDFYFNTSTGEIYVKEESGWVLQMVLHGESTTDPAAVYTVTFNPNGGSFTDSQIPPSVRVEEGHYVPSYSIPFCEKEGQTFIGWWTDEVLTPNSGHFTSLTPVFSDMTLYAQYE